MHHTPSSYCVELSRMGHPISEDNAENLLAVSPILPDEFYARHNVSHGSEFITNSRGIKQLTHWWTPLPPIKLIGILAMVHGYTGDSTNGYFQFTAVHFAKSGFATCAIDHQGHGFSGGLSFHIPDINRVVEDCIVFFDSFRNRHSSPPLPAFLYSESLGGAISLYITLRQKGLWSGLILNGAMCGISAKFKPPWPLEHLLPLVAALIPTWRVVPTRGTISKVSFKVEWKRRLVKTLPWRKEARPRASTALELVRVCKELQGRFEEVDVAFLISHGEKDVVCDPECVKDLYARAASTDKTIRVYPGMWHQLVGEPAEDVDLVFGEMVDWLKSRAERAVKSALPRQL